MENKIGYAYIALEDYKELIKDNERLDYYCDELKNETNKVIEEYASVEKAICEFIYKAETYHIKNYDGVGSYYHNELVNCFQKYGYISLDKINNLIKSLVERYNKEQEKNNE